MEMNRQAKWMLYLSRMVFERMLKALFSFSYLYY
uniref:Uncharacterized protein n=1 Tax=Arundo donax TaxID=35708 RepID=A0A0A9HPK1_ARUDO